MSLLYSDVEEELRSSVRQLLTARAPHAAILRRMETDQPYDTALWRSLAVDIGCAGFAVPEKFGGAGASWREAATVAEEFGRAVAPVPYLGAAMATAALFAAGDEDLLPAVAAGQTTAVLVLPFGTAPPVTVTGGLSGVADVLAADILLVPAADGLWAVEARHARLTPVGSLDLTRPLADVALNDAPSRRIGDAGPALDAAYATGAVLLASEQLGVAQWCLDTTVEYLKTRHQFGRPVGSFQALKHRLAELWVAVTQARAVARYAAGCLADDDPDLPVAVALAQAHCGPVAVRAAEECVQLHGGIGFTWEYPAHLYLKRAKADAIALGTAQRHRAALAALVGLAV
jgi:alkylation response protein AidB-like acyl-CoA dehydrogenase